ncbi:hypothetical protein WJX81_003127 [Elliptochloris bilobata]|uniref:SMP-LTD domain-containing protein n=1 Tax=Elliptochloris bilobata TaxID=381761 RepID=A0AAW1SK25_9CHLO
MINYFELLAVVLLLCAAPLAFVNWLLGGYTASLAGCYKLWRQGSIKCKSVRARPTPELSGLRVEQRKSCFTVFSISAIAADSSLWRILTGRRFELVVQEPVLDWTTDRNGASHTANVLADAGFIRLGKPAPKAGAAEAAPEGWEDVSAGEGVASAGGPLMPVEPREEDVLRPRLDGELRALTAHVLCRGGHLQLPRDLGMVVGEQLTFKALVGTASLEADAKASADTAANGEGEQEDWFAASRRPTPTEATGRVLYPVALAVHSEHLAMELLGWRTAAGMRLHRPLLLSMQFTPALAHYLFARLSPVLGAAVAFEGGGEVEVRLTPAGLVLPAETTTVRLEPMRLALASRGPVQSLIRLLKLGDKGVAEAPRLEAWTSAITADAHRSGLLVTHRWDLLLGPSARSGRGMRLAFWGQVLPGEVLELTLGLPAATLTPLGLSGLPPDYVFAIPVRGTSRQPRIDWVMAGAQLTELVVKHRVGQDLPFLRGLLNRPRKASGSDLPGAGAPPPLEPFPWDAAAAPADSQAQASDSKVDAS